MDSTHHTSYPPETLVSIQLVTEQHRQFQFITTPPRRTRRLRRLRRPNIVGRTVAVTKLGEE